MKKFIAVLVISFMAFGTVNIFGMETEEYDITVDEDGANGYIKEDRVMIPLRAVIEAAGRETQVVWNDEEKSVTIYMGTRISKITVGAETMVLNGTEIPVTVPAEITNERTFISLSDIATVLGISDDKIKWNSENNTAVINYQGEE